MLLYKFSYKAGYTFLNTWLVFLYRFNTSPYCISNQFQTYELYAIGAHKALDRQFPRSFFNDMSASVRRLSSNSISVAMHFKSIWKKYFRFFTDNTSCKTKRILKTADIQKAFDSVNHIFFVFREKFYDG